MGDRSSEYLHLRGIGSPICLTYLRAVPVEAEATPAIVAKSAVTEQPAAVSAPADRTTAESVVQSLILVILFAVPAIFWARTNGIHDPDIWWHLRSGQWIVQHHAVPRTDSFSSFAAGKPWEAYSWLFEVIVYKLFARLSYMGLMLYIGVMVVAITAAMHHMIKRLQRDFSLAILLTVAGAMCMGHLYTPRPWLFTILFFVLELDIVMQVRRTGRIRELFWLPLIFALWANIHIQFIDGLVVLALASAESVLALRWPMISSREGKRIPALAIPAAFAGCVLATLVNPYGPRLYKIAYDLNAQAGVLNLINELKAVPFRDLTDFTMLILALAACAMLARSRRLLPFEIALFAFAAFVSFRSQRDVWVMGTVAVAILAMRLAGNEKAKDHTSTAVGPLAALAASLAVMVSLAITHVTNPALRTQLSITEPVFAVDFVKQHGIAGPLYNDFNWGGYLIWNLPNLPVSIDGRAALMGQEHLDRSIGTMGAQAGWSTDPELTSAGVVIAPVTAPLSAVLQMDPRFHLVYQDKLAMVFVGKQPAIVKPAGNPSAVPLVKPQQTQQPEPHPLERPNEPTPKPSLMNRISYARNAPVAAARL
jgi:hypothetical protein